MVRKSNVITVPKNKERDDEIIEKRSKMTLKKGDCVITTGRQACMKITISVDDHLFNTIEKKRGNKSKSEFCNEILKSSLEPNFFEIYKGHIQEIIDIIHEEIDVTRYRDLYSKAVAENVFLREKLRRIDMVKDKSNRQFLDFQKWIDENIPPTPEYIAHCKKIMENPDTAKTIKNAHNNDFLFYEYVCKNIHDTYIKYNKTTSNLITNIH